MKAQNLFVFLLVVLFVSNSYAEINWPSPIPDVFWEGDGDSDPLHDPDTDQYFLIDQDWLEDWYASLGAGENIVLRNQNFGQFEEIDPDDPYYGVDYIIVSDLTFGDVINRDLDVEPGTEIWFALEPEDQVQVEGRWFGDGDIIGVCTITFTNGTNLNCNGGTFLPWIDLRVYLQETNQVPQHYPVEMDDDAIDGFNIWGEEFGTFFAGGFIFESANNTINNFSNFQNLIGATLAAGVIQDPHPENDDQVRAWILPDEAVPATNDRCCAFRLGNDASLTFDESTLENAIFNGFVIGGNNCQLSIEGDGTPWNWNRSNILRAWISQPDIEGGERFYIPNTNPQGAFPDRIYGVGNGITVLGDNAVIGINDSYISRNSLNGIEVIGDNCRTEVTNGCLIGGEDANSGNGLEREELTDDGDLEEEELELRGCISAGIRLLGGERLGEELSLLVDNSHINWNLTRGISISGGDNHDVKIDLNSQINCSQEIDDVENGFGIILKTSNNQVDVSWISQINSLQGVAMGAYGIYFDTPATFNTVNVTYGSEIRFNTRGVRFEGSNNTFNLYNLSHINNNGIGIDVRSSSNTITVNHVSTVNNNTIYGVNFRGASDNFIEDNTFDLHMYSEINENDINGVYMRYVDNLTFTAEDHCEISLNGSNGLLGRKVYRSTFTFENYCHIDWNEGCGIWLFWDAIWEGKDPLPSTEECIDDFVYLKDNSTCSNNECELPLEQAGILVQGYGHTIEIEDSEVLDNLDDGVKCEVWDWSRISVINSTISSNKKTGLEVMRPRELTIENSSFELNGEADGEDTHGLGVDVTRYAKTTRGENDPNPDPEPLEIPTLNIDVSTNSAFDQNHNSGIGINGYMHQMIVGGEIPDNSDCAVHINDCFFRNNGTHGICLDELLDVDGEIGNSEIESNPQYGIWIRTLRSGPFEEEGRLVGSEVHIHQCDIQGNLYGVYCGHQRVGEGNIMPHSLFAVGNVYLEGCEITDNQIGLRVWRYFSLGLIISPYDLGDGNLVPSRFYNNRDYSIAIVPTEGTDEEERDERSCALLIDAAVFDGEDVGGNTRPQNAHIFLTGQFKGWAPDDDLFNPTEVFSTIRKCKITQADGEIGGEENVKGIQLQSLVTQIGVGGPVNNHPFAHIRNNYFLENSTAIEVEFNEVLDDEAFIFNNTIVGDEAVATDIGIDILTFDGAENPTFGDFTIWNNSFEYLETGIFQRLDEADPSYPCQNFHEVTTNGINCNGEQEEENRWYEDDPLHYNDVNESERLLWNSKLINHGCPNKVDSTFITDSGTPEDPDDDIWYTNVSDIGCTGGGATQGILNHCAYNVMAEEVLLYENDFEFPADDYEIQDDFEICNSKSLTIVPNTLFSLHEDVNFRVDDGEIHADGFIDVPGDDPDIRGIRFQAHNEGEQWYRLSLFNLREDSEFNWCEVIDAEWGLRCQNTPGMGGVVLQVYDDYLEGGKYNLRVQYDDIWLDCQRTEMTGSIYDAVKFTDNDNANRSQLLDCNIHHNVYWNQPYRAGVYIKDSNVDIHGTAISFGDGYGLYTYDNANVQMRGDQGGANAICQNGTLLDGSPTYRGAEIRLRDDTVIDLSFNNIWDIESNGDRRGKLVWRNDDTNPNDIDATDVYWGDGRRGAADAVDNNFYWEGEGPIVDHSDHQENYIEGGAPDPETASPSDFDLGIAAMQDGQYERAIGTFQRFIDRNRISAKAQNALQNIFVCNRALENDLSEFQDELLSMAERYEDDYPRFAWRARKIACRCPLYSGDYDDAYQELEDLLEIAPNYSDSLIVEIDLLHVEDLIEANIDSDMDLEEEILRLEELLNGSDEINPIEDPLNIPENFNLSGAYPNPFNSSITITYQLPELVATSLIIFDLSGREITRLVSGNIDAGNHRTVWNSGNIPSGIYLCRMEAGGFVKSIKLVLAK